MSEIDIGETIKSNVDYWKNLCFEEQEKRKDVEEKLKICVAIITRGWYPEQNEGDNDFDKQFISREKIKEIRDKAEVMDYYTLNNVIDDLSKLIGDYGTELEEK